MTAGLSVDLRYENAFLLSVLKVRRKKWFTEKFFSPNPIVFVFYDATLWIAWKTEIKEPNDVWMLLLMIIEEINRQQWTHDDNQQRQQRDSEATYWILSSNIWFSLEITTDRDKKGISLFPVSLAVLVATVTFRRLWVLWVNRSWELPLRKARLCPSAGSFKIMSFSHIFGGI